MMALTASRPKAVPVASAMDLLAASALGWTFDVAPFIGS